MRKQIYHAKFCYDYSYQYYKSVKGNYLPTGSPITIRNEYQEHIFKENEEDAVWDRINKSLCGTPSKRFTIKNKRIEDLIEVGRTFT